MKKYVALALVATGAILQSPVAAQQTQQSFVRDPKVAIDAEYTQKIKEYTTEPFFNSPLTDYLPASKTVPTPKAVLGDVRRAGDPAVFARGVPVHAHAGKSQPARQGFHHRQDRRRPRNDRGRGSIRKTDR